MMIELIGPAIRSDFQHSLLAVKFSIVRVTANRAVSEFAGRIWREADVPTHFPGPESRNALLVPLRVSNQNVQFHLIERVAVSLARRIGPLRNAVLNSKPRGDYSAGATGRHRVTGQEWQQH